MATLIEAAQVHLPGECDVQVTRSFRAPRGVVYRAYTEPGLVRRWMLGPPGWTMPVCEMDVRVGGTFNWRWRSEAGDQEFGFSGVFREVTANERLVHTEHFNPGTLVDDGMNSGEPALVTTSFDEADGITTVTTHITYPTREIRDAALGTGMTDGMEQSYKLLDTLLLQKRTA